MYYYEELFTILNIKKTGNNNKKLKAIVNALIKSGKAKIEKQKIKVDIEEINYLWNLLLTLEEYFDYEYNDKFELTNILFLILNKDVLNLYAIFCPGYTNDGYKDYIGKNNSTKIETLKNLQTFLKDIHIDSKFNLYLADIFLENIDSTKNPNWKNELLIHKQKFLDLANNSFKKEEVGFLSSIFIEDRFVCGFKEDDLLKGKNYNSFYKNNIEFYQKMNWDMDEIRYRNDKLYTIYSLISNYIKENSGIYIPMETMYSRSKVMTKNGVSALYLKK